MQGRGNEADIEPILLILWQPVLRHPAVSDHKIHGGQYVGVCVLQAGKVFVYVALDVHKDLERISGRPALPSAQTKCRQARKGCSELAAKDSLGVYKRLGKPKILPTVPVEEFVQGDMQTGAAILRFFPQQISEQIGDRLFDRPDKLTLGRYRRQ